MNRLRAALNWIDARWPFALRSTVEGYRAAIATLRDEHHKALSIAERRVEVAKDLLIAETRRRQTLSATLESLANIANARPRVALEDPTPDEGEAA